MDIDLLPPAAAAAAAAASVAGSATTIDTLTPQSPAELWLAGKLIDNLDLFVAGTTAAAMRTVWGVLQRMNGCEVGRGTLARLLRYSTLSDLFAYAVNYRMSQSLSAAGNRGLSKRTEEKLEVDHLAFLERLRRARFNRARKKWEISATDAGSTFSA